MAIMIALPHFVYADYCWFTCHDSGWQNPPCEKADSGTYTTGRGGQCSDLCNNEDHFDTEYECGLALSGKTINPDDQTYACICEEENGASNCLYTQQYTDETKCKPDNVKYVSCHWQKGYCPDTAAGALPTAAITTDDKPQLTKPAEELVSPKNSISIPYLKYTPINPELALDAAGFLYIPWIGEFISTIYKIAIGVGSILAAVMIILQGMKIVTSGGGEEKTTAYKNIGRTLVGLVLLWGSFLILKTVNPDLVTFNALKIKYVEPILIEEEEDTVETPVTGDISQTTVIEGDNLSTEQAAEREKVLGTNITTLKTVFANRDVAKDVEAVAQELKAKKIGLLITSGFRPLQDQIKLILDNCKNPPYSAKCNPKDGRPNTCILADKKANSCPHTTGHAVDVWGTENGHQHILQKYCTKDPATDPCRQDPYQAAVIAAMKKAGFCVLDSEAWHFEKPKMSKTCH